MTGYYNQDLLLEQQAEIEKLQQRNAELAAQVEQLRKYGNLCAVNLSYSTDAFASEYKALWKKAAAAEPSQCLAEHDRVVAARAIEAAIKYNDACNSGMDYGSSHGGFYIHEFLEKIKSGEVEI